MKTKRHAKILDIVRNEIIETQEDLSARLVKDGYRVTQATISRDIRELKLTKVAVPGGKQKYVVLDSVIHNKSEKFVRVFRDGFISVDRAQNLVVIKTVSGMGMAVAAALDSMEFENVLGNVAGDDTILSVVTTAEAAMKYVDDLHTLAGERV